MSEESEANQPDSVSGLSVATQRKVFRLRCGVAFTTSSPVSLCVDPVEEAKDPETVVVKPKGLSYSSARCVLMITQIKQQC